MFISHHHHHRYIVCYWVYILIIEERPDSFKSFNDESMYIWGKIFIKSHRLLWRLFISKISWVKCFLGLKFRFIQQTIFHHKLEMISFPEYSFNIQDYNLSKNQLLYTANKKKNHHLLIFFVVTVDQCSWCLFLLVSFFYIRGLFLNKVKI